MPLTGSQGMEKEYLLELLDELEQDIKKLADTGTMNDCTLEHIKVLRREIENADDAD